MSPQKALQKYLMASYVYYNCSHNVMSDTEYDQLAVYLLEHWDEFEHQHKHLVSKEDLQAGTLFALGPQDYPRMVVGGAEIWMDEQERMIKVAGVIQEDVK